LVIHPRTAAEEFKEVKNNQRPNGAKKLPTFITRAERAFGRVARKLRAENQKLGLPAVVWPNGKRLISRTSSSGRSLLSRRSGAKEDNEG
jgi:hypothetical protein